MGIALSGGVAPQDHIGQLFRAHAGVGADVVDGTAVGSGRVAIEGDVHQGGAARTGAAGVVVQRPTFGAGAVAEEDHIGQVRAALTCGGALVDHRPAGAPSLVAGKGDVGQGWAGSARVAIIVHAATIPGSVAAEDDVADGGAANTGVRTVAVQTTSRTVSDTRTAAFAPCDHEAVQACENIHHVGLAVHPHHMVGIVALDIGGGRDDAVGIRDVIVVDITRQHRHIGDPVARVTLSLPCPQSRHTTTYRGRL